MPLPILVGLSAWISSVGGSIASVFAAIFAKKIATTILAIAALVTLTGALFATFNTFVSSVESVAPEWIVLAAGWIIPDNLAACFSTWMSARTARFVYDWQVKGIEFRLMS